MTAPLVSICVPTYNRSSFLRDSLESIQRQDYPRLEVLISDNASSDETEQVCTDAAAGDGRIRYVRQPRNIGMHANHNFLIEESRGEFLAFFHDDDLYRPEIVSAYVRFLTSWPNVGLVCSDWDLIDDAGRVIGSRRHRVPPVTKGHDYIDRTLRSGQSSLGCPGTMIRRSALADIRFDESGSIGFGDFAVWFQVAEGADVGHVEGELWQYRLHGASLSRRTITAIANDYRQTMNQYCAGYQRRRPAEGHRVERWSWDLSRYLFWALAYEIGLAFRRPESSSESIARYRTVFELSDYRPDPQDLARALGQMQEYRRGVLQTVVHRLIAFLVRVRWTRPLGWAARYPLLLRRLMGMN